MTGERAYADCVLAGVTFAISDHGDRYPWLAQAFYGDGEYEVANIYMPPYPRGHFWMCEGCPLNPRVVKLALHYFGKREYAAGKAPRPNWRRK